MATTEYSKLTDAQLEQTRVALMSELERRRNLARIPADVRSLMEQYEAAGGDPAELTAELGGSDATPAN